MDSATVNNVLRDGVMIVLKLGGPLLLLSMVVGLVVAIFQAVTQIHEQTLGFILKLVTIVTVLLIGGGWMMDQLVTYAQNLYAIIAS